MDAPPGQNRRSILLMDSDRAQLRNLAQILRALVGRVEIRESLGDSRGEEFDLVIVGYDGLPPADRQRVLELVRARHNGLFLVSPAADHAQLVQLLGEAALTNLVAKNPDMIAEDLVVTVQKLLRKEIFGLEKYFAWGVEPRVLRTRRSSEKRDVVAQARAYAEAIGIHPRIVDLFCTVTDELVTNALFNAPRAAGGGSRFGHLPRSKEVVLEPNEELEIRFCCDGRRAGISAADPFGALTPEQVHAYLQKCFRRGPDQIDTKDGGAGLGLYYIFESINHFVINLAPGRRTEVVALFDIRGTYRDFRSRGKSFNIFVEPSWANSQPPAPR